VVTRASLAAWLSAVVVGIGAFVAARIAMLPGLGYWDTAELQTVAPILGTAHPTGFPTYVLLGWVVNVLLTPFGEPALRMNLFAALSVAVAAAVTVDLVRALTRSVPLGMMAGIGLALTSIVWDIGTHAEAHALHLAFVAILFRLLLAWEDGRRDRTLVAAAIVFGLAAGNHSLILLLGPPIALYVLAVDPEILRRPRFIAGCSAALVLTVVLIYLELPLRAGLLRTPGTLVYGRPDTWDGFWYIALAEQFRGSVVGPFDDLPGKVGALVDRTVVAFGPLAALLPVAFGVTAIRRPSYALLSGTAVVITCFFAASYVNALIERYYLGPVLIGWTWVAMLGEGLATLVGISIKGQRRPDRVIATALTVLLLVPTVATAPSRLERLDRSGDVGARQWVDHALQVMQPNAVIVSWWSYSTPLWYAQLVEDRRPDIDIIDDRTRLDRNLGDIYDVIDANLPTRPVYVIRIERSEIEGLKQRYVLDVIGGTEASVLTRIIGSRDTAG
jgi:transmembrane protein TMEM260 (protein O-mannosyltransferase)